MGLYGKNSLRLASETKAVFIIKKINCCFLFLLVFSVCAQKEKLPVVSKAKELKTVKGKKIIWKKDGAKMGLVRSYNQPNIKKRKHLIDWVNQLLKRSKSMRCYLYGLI